MTRTSAATTKRAPGPLQPFLRAYLLGYLSSTTPRIVGILLALIRRKYDLPEALLRLSRTLRRALAYNRFPAFCGVLVGGSTLLRGPVRELLLTGSRYLHGSTRRVSRTSLDRASRFLAALLSAWVSFSLLNSESSQRHDGSKTSPLAASTAPLSAQDQLQQYGVRTSADLSTIPSLPPEPSLYAPPPPSTPLAGRTIDLTLFALIRALDVLLPTLLSPLTPTPLLPTIQPTLFALSVATIMHAWCYTPSRLPRAYNTWITRASGLDPRLRLALRHAQAGSFRYGADTGIAPLLGSLAAELTLPFRAGDPATTVPLPCAVVHSGAGLGCERHALARFAQAARFAATMYGPLHLLVALRLLLLRAPAPSSSPTARARHVAGVLATAVAGAARSSAFLASFVALFYYGVCLARTRLGPRLFPPPPPPPSASPADPAPRRKRGWWSVQRPRPTPQDWDAGLCVAAGCALCGWSVLVEHPRRRAEVLLFVLPRAAAVLAPRRYDARRRWREQGVFAVAAAVVLAAAQEEGGRARVRGVLGRVLGGVLV